jgi:transposase
MRHRFILILLVILLAGCETTQVYNPVDAPTQQTFLINESSFRKIAIGMSQSQVHQIMGDTIIIGYAYQKPVSEQGVDVKVSTSDYKPLTITNPYKTEELKTKDGLYTVEYFVNLVKNSDGVISDDELVPLVFREGLLIAKGKEYLKALRLKISQ